MRITIKAEDITVRNRAYGEARSQGRLATRTIRDKTKYRRKEKHKKRLTA